MFDKIKSLKNIFGSKNWYAFIFTLLLSLVVSFLEFIGIGSLAIFAVSISDVQIILEKIPYANLQNYLASVDKITFVSIFALVIFLAFLFKHLITYLIFYFEIKIIKRITLRIKQQIFKSFLKENYEYYINNNKSELLNLVGSQVGSFLAYIYNIITIIKESILVFIIFFGMLFINWKIVIFLTLTLCTLTYLFSKKFKKKLNDTGEQVKLLDQRELKHLNESYESIKFIKLGNSYNFFSNILTQINQKKNKHEILHFLVGKLPKVYLELLMITIFMFIVLYLLSTSQNDSSIYGLITFLAFSIIRIMPSFISINNSYTNLNYFKSPFEIIFNKTKNLDTTDTTLIDKQLKENIDKITFENVKFKYTNSNKINLDNINFSILKNDVLGIVGSSGSGKSTILNLLCGLLYPSGGKIKYNNKDISINPEILLKRISYISQDTYLLDDSIKNNIVFANSNIVIDEVRFTKVIKMSNLDNFVDNLPNKENTIIGDKGSKISNGQRQRIGIARALYSDPDIFLFDESLNALDYDNEEIILNNIIRNSKNKFIIFVSHRIESLKYCNNLMLINEGKITDYDKKLEVLKRNNDLQKYFEQR
jgi:ATP-binding cassette, subfamily B, bacterial PglK